MTTPLQTDFDTFLYAPVAYGVNGMPLTMLSVLARLGVDPWTEAAKFAALSRESATQKLILLLAAVPNGPSPGADTATEASRLVELLHQSPKPRVSPAGVEPSGPAAAAPPKRAKLAIYYLLVLIIMVVGQWMVINREATPPATTSAPASR